MTSQRPRGRGLRAANIPLCDTSDSPSEVPRLQMDSLVQGPDSAFRVSGTFRRASIKKKRWQPTRSKTLCGFCPGLYSHSHKDVHSGLTSSSRWSAGLDGCLFKSHLYLCAADVCGFASPILSPASCTMTRLSGCIVTTRVSEAAARYVGGCAVSWSQSERVAWRPNPWPLILGSSTSQPPPPTCIRAELQSAQCSHHRHHRALH